MGELMAGLIFLAAIIIFDIIAVSLKRILKPEPKKRPTAFCVHCYAPMMEEDVFCTNCWRITPKVQEMLNRFPTKKPNDYYRLHNGKRHACPHCKYVYRISLYNPMRIRYGCPLKYCPKCHNYFTDVTDNEWSVYCLPSKASKFFLLLLWIFVVCSIIEIYISLVSWQEILLYIFKYTIIHIIFCIIWHFTVRKKAVKESKLRLERNPEYPQILIDMGYGFMMEKKYHALYKEKPITWKDVIKEAFAEAFTFD